MEKLCKHCGKAFDGRKGKLYCSDECSYKERYIPRKKTKGICEYCGKEYVRQNRPDQRWCSAQCRRTGESREKGVKERVYSSEKQCENCKIVFRNKSNKRYCSLDCFNEAIRNGTNPCLIRRKGKCKGCNQDTDRIDIHFCSTECRLYATSLCLECGSLFNDRPQRKFCSKKCIRAAQNRKIRKKPQYQSKYPKRVVVCRNCGERFTTRHSLKSFCSHACGYLFRRKHKQKSYCSNKIKRTLINNSNGKCAICFEQIRMNESRTSLSPSVDHITPICKGGTHDIENLQLTHLRCNLQKQGREEFYIVREQLLLPTCCV